MKNFFNSFNRDSLKKYFTQTSWLLAEKVIRMIILLFTGLYLARFLGPEKFGILNYALSFVAIFTTVAMLGLDNIVTRELVSKKHNEHEILGTAFWLELFSSIILFLAIYIIIPFINKEATTNFVILIIAAGLIFKSFKIIESYFFAKILSKYIAWAYIVQLIISAILIVAFIQINAPLLWFAFIFFFENVTLAFLSIYFYILNKQNIFNWKFSKNAAFKLLKDSWPLILSGLTISVYMKIDQLMIKNILDAQAVGIYSVAVRISEVWYFIPVIICDSLFPAILHTREKNNLLYFQRLNQLYGLMIWISLSLAIIITIFSSPIISILFGSEYAQASDILKIHIWAGIFVFLGVASNKYLISENYTKISFARTFTGMLVNIILNISLIPKYGIAGAAIATIISYGVSTFSILFMNKSRNQGFEMLKAFNIIKSIKFITQKEYFS